jgi:ribosome-binding ATPase
MLEAGIVGLSSAGKTTLFNALTKAGVGPDFGKEHVGMAPIADERLDQVGQVVSAAKVTPAAVRVVDTPGTGPQLLGNLRRVDALLAVVDGYSAGADPDGDLERLELELLVADRDHVERRLERVTKQAKSGDAKLRDEVAELERLLAHVDAGRSVREWEGPLPPELEPLTTKPVVTVVNGPGGIDLKLEAELSELPEQEAAAYREGESALDEIVRRLFEVLGLVTFFTAGEKEARGWTLRRGQTALEAAGTIHSDIARGFIRCEVVRWNDLVEAGSYAETARRGLQRLEGKTYEVQDGDVLTVRFNV